MKKLLVLTDSLGLPRDVPEKCEREETWPVLLTEYGYEVHQISVRGATSTEIKTQILKPLEFSPDMVIVQVGIVDCAPRHVTRLELQALRKIPFFGRRILRLLNKPIIRKIRKITYVSPKKFEINIQTIKDNFSFCPVVFIGIMPATKMYEKLLPGVTENVLRYNTILSKIGAPYFLDVSAFPPETLMSDHHHLSVTGQKTLIHAVIGKIEYIASDTNDQFVISNKKTSTL